MFPKFIHFHTGTLLTTELNGIIDNFACRTGLLTMSITFQIEDTILFMNLFWVFPKHLIGQG